MSLPAVAQKTRVPNIYLATLRKLLAHRIGLTGLLMLMALVAIAVGAGFIAPYDPVAPDYGAILSAPASAHLLGTDELGRDMLSRLIYGARVSIQVVFVAIAAAMAIGISIGLLAGYVGGWVDDILMRLMDVMLAFPLLILALAIIADCNDGHTAVLDHLNKFGYSTAIATSHSIDFVHDDHTFFVLGFSLRTGGGKEPFHRFGSRDVSKALVHDFL